MADLPSVLGAIAKNEGVLHALYTDLAAPGVRQVGAALETVLKTGNILLMPLRMLNEHAANVERRNFEEIAERFKDIPESEIIDVRPEIGVPILEKLSATEDPDLRSMFIELLASAADKNKVSLAHPSFVRVIESFSPDEAKIIEAWKTSPMPSLMVGLQCDGGSARLVYDPFVEVPDSVSFPNLASMYVANLAGLGLVVHHNERYVPDDDAYDGLIEGVEKEVPGIKEKQISVLGKRNDIVPGDHFYKKGCIQITPYGKAFQRACLT